MPRQASKCCEFIVKDTLKRETKVWHIKFNKTKAAYYVKGEVLNLAYDCDTLKSEKHYRICASLMWHLKEGGIKMKARANVIDGVRERTAVVSTTKNLRQLQEAFRLIVEAMDRGGKQKK